MGTQCHYQQKPLNKVLHFPQLLRTGKARESFWSCGGEAQFSHHALSFCWCLAQTRGLPRRCHHLPALWVESWFSCGLHPLRDLQKVNENNKLLRKRLVSSSNWTDFVDAKWRRIHPQLPGCMLKACFVCHQTLSHALEISLISAEERLWGPELGNANPGSR